MAQVPIPSVSTPPDNDHSSGPLPLPLGPGAGVEEGFQLSTDSDDLPLAPSGGEATQSMSALLEVGRPMPLAADGHSRASTRQTAPVRTPSRNKSATPSKSNANESDPTASKSLTPGQAIPDSSSDPKQPPAPVQPAPPTPPPLWRKLISFGTRPLFVLICAMAVMRAISLAPVDDGMNAACRISFPPLANVSGRINHTVSACDFDLSWQVLGQLNEQTRDVAHRLGGDALTNLTTHLRDAAGALQLQCRSLRTFWLASPLHNSLNISGQDPRPEEMRCDLITASFVREINGHLITAQKALDSFATLPTNFTEVLRQQIDYPTPSLRALLLLHDPIIFYGLLAATLAMFIVSLFSRSHLLFGLCAFLTFLSSAQFMEVEAIDTAARFRRFDQVVSGHVVPQMQSVRCNLHSLRLIVEPLAVCEWRESVWKPTIDSFRKEVESLRTAAMTAAPQKAIHTLRNVRTRVLDQQRQLHMCIPRISNQDLGRKLQEYSTKLGAFLIQHQEAVTRAHLLFGSYAETCGVAVRELKTVEDQLSYEHFAVAERMLDEVERVLDGQKAHVDSLHSTIHTTGNQLLDLNVDGKQIKDSVSFSASLKKFSRTSLGVFTGLVGPASAAGTAALAASYTGLAAPFSPLLTLSVPGLALAGVGMALYSQVGVELTALQDTVSTLEALQSSLSEVGIGYTEYQHKLALTGEQLAIALQKISFANQRFDHAYRVAAISPDELEWLKDGVRLVQNQLTRLKDLYGNLDPASLHDDPPSGPSTGSKPSASPSTDPRTPPSETKTPSQPQVATVQVEIHPEA